MKIAFINKYQNRVQRGAETFVFELSKRLSKNHEIDILTSLTFKKRYDLLIPTNGRFQVIATRIISWLTRAKMVVSGQSGIGWDDKVNLYALPDCFVALSRVALEWAKRANPFVKSVYIPNGVDLERFRGPTSKSRLKRGPTSTVLCVGAFTRQKRLDLAIRAVSKLKGVSLVVAGGGGELKKELADLGNQVLKNRFNIISVPFEKMPEVYRSAAVFTLPSASSESFGNVLVEAMATGLPVVATNDPIRREIVGDAGILVDPTDTEKYSLSLRKAMQTNWGERPRRQAEKFNWDKIARAYEELFKTLLNKK